MLTKSLFSISVGGPRIDSTCFLDIPSVTSSTFALVRRLPTQETPSTSRSTSTNRKIDRKIDPLRTKGGRLNQSAGSPTSICLQFSGIASSCLKEPPCFTRFGDMFICRIRPSQSPDFRARLGRRPPCNPEEAPARYLGLRRTVHGFSVDAARHHPCC